jgi:hypothetical protein
MGSQFQMRGFHLAGFLCLLLAVLKLTIEGHWSWWRVLLPLWVVLGHNALYIAVGFVWLSFADDDGASGEEVTIRQRDGSYAYQVAALLCFVIFGDNLLGRIEGTAETTWFGLRSVGADRGVRCPQRGVSASVLVYGITCKHPPKVGRRVAAPRESAFTSKSTTILRMRVRLFF